MHSQQDLLSADVSDLNALVAQRFISHAVPFLLRRHQPTDSSAATDISFCLRLAGERFADDVFKSVGLTSIMCGARDTVLTTTGKRRIRHHRHCTAIFSNQLIATATSVGGCLSSP